MSLDSDISLLSRIALFSDLSTEHLRLLAFSAVRTELLTDQILFREGAAATGGYVVSSGEIELSTGVGRGRKVVGTGDVGCLIGELALFIETKRPATATALRRTEVLEISRTQVVRMLNEYPHVALRFRATLAQRLSATVNELGKVGKELDRQSGR